jgi:hypothetical protein
LEKEDNKMAYIMVDVESDGPIPGDFSMISFGAVLVDGKLDKTFYGKLRPISDKFLLEALAVSGYSREETMLFPHPGITMADFWEWIKKVSPDDPRFIADCSYDWMFMCWYFHHYFEHNPFGYFSYDLSSLYKGIDKDMNDDFEFLRKTVHTHNPVDDAMGNAEALLVMKNKLGLKIKL